MTAGDALHEAAHAGRVHDAIRRRIAEAGGWLPFDQYMQLALYEPGLGYYSAGAHKFGAGGDFTTAPELSPLFGRCLARHCVEVLAACGGGDVVEIGAGSGQMAFDVLAAMQAGGTAPRRYRILEVSAELRERQRQRLASLPADVRSRVEWLDVPPHDPWRGALLANEVLDALPVECFAWRDREILARGVASNDAGGFAWSERPASQMLHAEVARLHEEAGSDWPSPFLSEVCRRVGPWLTEVTRELECGVALLIDYGLPRREYYAAARDTGTLRCHHRHRAHADPFAHPGLEDITAWVDFTRVAEAANAAGLDVLGYATQAALLLGLGIEQDVASANGEAARVRRASEARQLLMPEQMGESFKAMALGRGCDVPLSGFVHQDLRSRL